MPTILVIDDNRAVSTALEVLFSLHDIDTLHAESPAAGLALLREQPVDLVIQDMNFSEDTTSGLEGEQLFADLRNEWPDMPVILLTAWTHLEAAVNLVKAGAADYVAKPWDDRKLLATVNTLLELTEDTCHWPIGDPGSPDFFFCGGKSLSSLPYCAHHSRVAYQPAADRRRDRRPSK